MQRGTTVEAHGLRSLLELLLAGLVVLVMIIVFLLLVAASGGPFFLIIFAAVASLATTLLAGSLSTSLGLLLVASFILSFLLLDKLFDFLATLEVVPLGAVDLAVSLAGAILLVGGCQNLTVGARGALLAGASNFGFGGASVIARLLDG